MSPQVTPQATVMLVDSDVDSADAHRIALESRGYAVVVAHSARYALKRLEECCPRLVVLDVMIGTLTDGYHLVRAIRSDSALVDTKIVVLSAANREFPQVEEEVVRNLLEVDAYYDRPLQPSRLVKIIAELLQ